MAEATPYTHESSSIHLQKNFGMLSRLPLEIRLMIWHHFIPGANTTKERTSLQCTRYLGDRQSDCGSLSILRTSRLLCAEITNELYRNRVLTICVNINDHKPSTRNIDQSNIFIQRGGICKETDPQQIDYSKFKALDIRIQIPHSYSSGYDLRTFCQLTSGLSHVAQIVQHQRSSIKQRFGRFPRNPNVLVDQDTSRADDYWCIHSPPEILDVLYVLRGLRTISGAEDVKIEVRVKLGEEKKLLLLLVRNIEENMRHLEIPLGIDEIELGKLFSREYWWLDYFEWD